LTRLYIFRFRHPDYDPDRAQKLISSSISGHLSTRKISSKSMHAFLSNLANRQSDKHRGQSHIPPPLSEVNKKDRVFLSHGVYSTLIYSWHRYGIGIAPSPAALRWDGRAQAIDIHYVKKYHGFCISYCISHWPKLLYKGRISTCHNSRNR